MEGRVRHTAKYGKRFWGWQRDIKNTGFTFEYIYLVNEGLIWAQNIKTTS